MKKPELVIDSGPADDFISIRCSSCDDFVVRIEGNTLSNKVLMRGLYDLHFKQVHKREDGQSATPKA
jgi:hypothetical protein